MARRQQCVVLPTSAFTYKLDQVAVRIQPVMTNVVWKYGALPASMPIVGSAEHVLQDAVLKDEGGEEEHPQMGRRPSKGFASIQGLIRE